MPQLSIFIPALGPLERMESTLASVLQNRPDDCEVVVALPCAYDDPYALADEVRFVVAAGARSTAELMAAGLRAVGGDVLHVLAAGAEVEDGWTTAPVERFADARIAAVAPLVVRSRGAATVCSAGVEYGLGGARRRNGCGDAISEHLTDADVLGPTSVAGFYRTAALRELAAPFDTAVGDRLLDVDVALQLRAAGYRAVYEPRSIVYREQAATAPSSGLRQGLEVERLFWRHASQFGGLRAAAAHVLTLAGDLFTADGWSTKLARYAGRACALFDVAGIRRFRRAQAAVGAPGLAYGVTATGDRFRIDAAHPRRPASAPARIPADRRSDGDLAA